MKEGRRFGIVGEGVGGEGEVEVVGGGESGGVWGGGCVGKKGGGLGGGEICVE